MIKEFVYKGKTIKVNPNIMDEAKINASLNTTQLAHRRGLLDVYEPIVAYSTKWETKYDKNGQYLSAAPVENSSKRNDLPPVYMQWKDAAKK